MAFLFIVRILAFGVSRANVAPRPTICLLDVDIDVQGYPPIPALALPPIQSSVDI